MARVPVHYYFIIVIIYNANNNNTYIYCIIIGFINNVIVLNNLLDPHQSGFKATQSTETALLAVTDSLRYARSSSLSSVLILLDFSAAFDAVKYQILLSTLAQLGIAVTVILVHFLPDRSHLSGHMEWLSVQTLHP